jgi:glycosyltransferase involved in cell wall biosynthesis
VIGALHQFVPTFEPGAVGSHVLELQKMAWDTGWRAEIYSEHLHPELTGRGRFYREYEAAARPDDVCVYQMAIGSVVADFLLARSEPLVLNHHNLTPIRYLNSWDPGTTYGVTWGQAQLLQLAPRTALGIAVSTYNEADLKRAGFEHTTVVPVLVDLPALAGHDDPATDARLVRAKRDGGADWIFVGRVAPNKCQHQIIKSFAAYRRVYDPHARLWLVGGITSPAYGEALGHFIEELGLARSVTLTGSVSQGALVSYYRHADAFVCLSEHEGFCIPLLEAMWHGVPIVALASSAIPETLGPAGILVPFTDGRQPSPGLVAAAVHRAASDGATRDHLVKAGAARVEEFSLERTRSRFREALSLLNPI